MKPDFVIIGAMKCASSSAIQAPQAVVLAGELHGTTRPVVGQ
jgi:hypothetical protein